MALYGQHLRCVYGQQLRCVYGQQLRCVYGQQLRCLYGQQLRCVDGQQLWLWFRLPGLWQVERGALKRMCEWQTRRDLCAEAMCVDGRQGVVCVLIADEVWLERFCAAAHSEGG